MPYFKAGLENNERCLWVTGKAFSAEQARSALRAAVSDLDRRERDKQIEIADGDEWYSSGERLRPPELVSDLMRRERDALELGYAGLRTNGNCGWVSQDQWKEFGEYERLVQKTVRGRRMICMCSYCMDQLRNGSHSELMESHDLALPIPPRSLPRRLEEGSLLEPADPALRETNAHERLRALERQKKTFDLAMVASQMGTWRYTLADNVCNYDENAQRLYGLNAAHFVHDDEGVKAKFHPDDLDLMWSRVAAALDPLGDGRYEVEYRVKQIDGSWRWLSAWGLVEFDGAGADKRAVAIVGASRDLTERKQGETLQRLLLDELNHRIKNTFAAIQAVTSQTLRAARDLPSAREALERRIVSMANAHDLLTARAWTGADLNDIVVRALDVSTTSQTDIRGPAVDVPPRHALALSMALHELATNSIKYGALSSREGRISVRWHVEEGRLHLSWEEAGGPSVAPPTRSGFGTQLLETVIRGLEGDVSLNYDASGLRCKITAGL